jgi:GR25 family glycosyltransferase involved in LPS biosynthesis
MFSLNNVDFYCICMDNVNGNIKWERVDRIFNQQKIKIKRYIGVNGKDLIVPKICPYSNTEVNLNNGNYGCFLSHINIIKESKNRNLDYVLIFEDDIKLSDDFYDCLIYLEKCNIDFDMFYFGGAFNNFTNKIEKTENKFIYKYKGAAGLHAYIVSSSIYDYILNNIRFDRAIDGFYSTVIGYQPDVRLTNKKYFDIKGFYPHPAGCEMNYSELSNTYTDNGMNLYFKNKILI